jgi:solute:Na+ symporter, SSS family
MANAAMTATFLAVIGGASLLAVTARRLRPSDRLPSLEGWALADRSLGPVWTWLLLGGTISTGRPPSSRCPTR